jgi:DNA polymerase III epsilon subunit-like protein
MKDVMLDLETFGTRHDALIVQIGACYFDRMTGEVGDTFKATIDPGEDAHKFSIDYGTVMWWLEQSQHARDSILGRSETKVSLHKALTDFNLFVARGDVLIWSHATFDMPILVNAFRTLGFKPLVPFRNARDLRTLMDLAALEKMKRERFGVHHDALDDAKFQASYAADAFVKLNGYLS